MFQAFYLRMNIYLISGFFKKVLLKLFTTMF